MNIGQIKFFKPKEKALIPLIKGYCIHTSDDADFYLKIRFYQNTTNTISVYQNSLTTENGKSRVQTHQPENGLNTLLVGLIDGYQEVEFIGPLQRVAIIFHSGGLNHFLRQPLSVFLKKNYSTFNYFNDELNELVPKLFLIDQVENQRSVLDDFFLTRLLGFDQPILMNAIALLSQDNLLKVQDLADQLGMHRRTLLRKFKQHLGLSIEAYKKVCRFRKALFKFQASEGLVNLTNVALDSQYYDQADFSHQLKTTSGLTPKELFAKLKIIDETLFWLH